MRTSKKKDLPFKMKTKKVFERKIDGPNVLVMSLSDERDVRVKPERYSDSLDGRIISKITDKDFVLEGWLVDDVFYCCDVLYHDEKDLRETEWNERYRILKNDFNWNYNARLSKPIVIASNTDFDAEREVKDAAMIFKQLENTEGIMIRDYDELYGETREYIPISEVGDY